jgi:hypothetical protein
MRFRAFLPGLLLAGAAVAAPLNCDLSEYKEQSGLKAEMAGDALRLTWQGERGQELRASFGIDNGTPLVRELAAHKSGGSWAVLGRDLRPEFSVTSGQRRMSEQQLQPLRELKREITEELLAKERWNAFWDAPLVVPGNPNGSEKLPRKPEEIHRATASYNANACKVKTDGGRIEVSFPGLSMGIFSGRLQFTAYKGTNLLRQEAIARTDEPWVAYMFRGGLKGFKISDNPRVVWEDTARNWQKYEFGGSPNAEPVALKARSRVALVETAQGSLAVFPPPHKFFWAREIQVNLGYVWYRKDDANTYTLGVRHSEKEEQYRPYGFTDDVWRRRTAQARQMSQGNFALYNAPPGTWQRMGFYFYLSAEPAQPTRAAVMAYTHDDRYKPMPGYQVAIGHFHTHFWEEEADSNTLDLQPPWIPTFRGMGINIAMMSDFHADGHPKDPGAVRLQEQEVYFEASKRHSDRDFLIVTGEEPDAYFGGHYTMVFPHPVYWTHVRQPGQPLVENHPKYGKVYHVGSAADELEMVRREGGFVWQAHPRTKGATGYPDASRETEHFRSDRFLGASYQSLPVDLSESRICEKRCFSTFDDMNNWAGPKYLLAEGDTYTKYPEDELYPELQVNYVKLDRVPSFEKGWEEYTKSLRAGTFFVTSGEVLIPQYTVEGTGAQRTVSAQVEWTFPLEFVEVVWGDGDKIDRKIVPATEMGAFGNHRFRIPFDAAGKKWVRFAVWDSAGNGAFTQPVILGAR